MKLNRELTFLDVFCTATGAMISSGLFVLPGLAHALAGPAVVVSYLIAGLLAMTGMLSQAELASAMPKTGGTYFYVMRSMGPAVGTVDGLVTWFSLSLKTAFALVGMAAFAHIVLPGVDVRAMAVVLAVVFVVVNLIGIKEAGRLQVALVVGLLAILAFYVARGLPAVRVAHFAPFAPQGGRAILSTAGFVFISYGGLLKVAAVAEEVKDPSRTIPRAMILSLIVVSVLYTLVVFVTSGVVPSEQLNHSLTPISDGAGVIMGRPGTVLLSVAAVLAFVSTANAGIMASARYPLALARDGLIPARIGGLHSRFRTPHIALYVTGGFIVSVLFLDLAVLVKFASSVLVLTFFFSCLSVIIMRESRVQNYQPRFKSPFYPWMQIAGTAGCLALLSGIGAEAVVFGSVLVGSGLFLYWFYGRIRATREYALLHLMERITSRELTDHLLETELKEIIRERDDILEDRFDRLVEKCLVLDLDGVVSRDLLFDRVSEAMSPRLGLSPKALRELLEKREADSSTVIAPGLAVPHIVLDGERRFDILLARCVGGVQFSDQASDVQAIFVLVGTRDERNYHLRALAAIAQIAQQPDFRKRWVRARGEQGLRDVVLLGKRMRQ